MKMILIAVFLILTGCTTTAQQVESDSTIPRLQGIADVLTCMFEPDSEECARAKALNKK
tara:strand:- start:2011 stop:2187 length:177 start_codon:yes stop_codon:yes gene_type:complete